MDAFGDRYFNFGAKDIDDEGDWTDADDLDGDGKASKNWDGGRGLVGFDDDADGEIDEDGADGPDSGPDYDVNGDGNCNYDPEARVDEDPAGDMARDYVDNDFDGLVDMEDSDNDGDCCPGFPDDDGDGLDDEDGVARGAGILRGDAGRHRSTICVEPRRGRTHPRCSRHAAHLRVS